MNRISNQVIFFIFVYKIAGFGEDNSGKVIIFPGIELLLIDILIKTTYKNKSDEKYRIKKN